MTYQESNSKFEEQTTKIEFNKEIYSLVHGKTYDIRILLLPKWHTHLGFISELTYIVPQGLYGEYISRFSPLWQQKFVG